MRRRDFVRRLPALGAAAVLAARLGAQEQTRSTATNTMMDQGAARGVRRPPKPGAAPSMTPDERDALEHRLRCQCGCTLDIYTCRTTDFTCQVSPAMHRDVMWLVEGGYGAQEIIDAFVGEYGERVLMAPTKQGFNWAGYLVPFAAMGGAGVAVAALIRRWGRDRGTATATPLRVDATPDELRRLDAAVRDDA